MMWIINASIIKKYSDNRNSEIFILKNGIKGNKRTNSMEKNNEWNRLLRLIGQRI